MATPERYILCELCSHPILAAAGKSFTCPHCGHREHRLRPRSARLSLVFSLTALIFYIPALIFPFMTIEMYGNRNSSTIWSGVVELAASGAVAIALIVFLASILIPIIKLMILFYLSLDWHNHRHQKFKTSLYRFVEAIGRWSMLDIFLLAVLVAILKLGPMTNVQPEKGSFMFALVVIFTMLASAVFDPKMIWEEKQGEIP